MGMRLSKSILAHALNGQDTAQMAQRWAPFPARAIFGPVDTSENVCESFDSLE